MEPRDSCIILFLRKGLIGQGCFRIAVELDGDRFSILTIQDAFSNKLWAFICESTDLETVRIILWELFAVIPRPMRLRGDNAFGPLEAFLKELGIAFKPSIPNHSQSGSSIERANLVLEKSIERMGFTRLEDLICKLPSLVQEINSTPKGGLAGFTPDEVYFGIEFRKHTPSMAESTHRFDQETWRQVHNAASC